MRRSVTSLEFDGVDGGSGGGDGGGQVMEGSVPVWLEVPGFWKLSRFAKVRATEPWLLAGKTVYAVDTDGRHASIFLANNAR